MKLWETVASRPSAFSEPLSTQSLEHSGRDDGPGAMQTSQTGHVLGNETLQNLPRGSGPALVYKCCRGPSVSCDRVENQLRRKTKCGPAPGTAAACPSCGGGRTRQSCRRSERRRRRRAGRLGLYLPTSHESHYFRFVACAVGGVMTTSRNHAGPVTSSPKHAIQL